MGYVEINLLTLNCAAAISYPLLDMSQAIILPITAQDRIGLPLSWNSTSRTQHGNQSIPTYLPRWNTARATLRFWLGVTLQWRVDPQKDAPSRRCLTTHIKLYLCLLGVFRIFWKQNQTRATAFQKRNYEHPFKCSQHLAIVHEVTMVCYLTWPPPLQLFSDLLTTATQPSW